MRDDFSPFGGKMFRIEKREMDTTHEMIEKTVFGVEVRVI